MSAGDRAAEQLLARALRLRDEPDAQRSPSRVPVPAVMAAATSPAKPEPLAEPEPVAMAEPGPEPLAEPELGLDAVSELLAEPEPEFVAERPPELAAETAERVQATADAETELTAAPEPVTEDVPALEPVAEAVAEDAGSAQVTAEDEPAAESEEPSAVGVMVGVDEQVADASAEPAPQPTGDELLAAAEAAEEAGDDSSLRSLLLWTARAYAREGRFEAGLDTAHRLLMRSPSDVDAHLVLVELYVARSWDALAAEKLLLLGRLADLDGDDVTRRRLCQAASRAFPGNERLEALCA